MGQGTESCGGYEVEYDPWEDGIGDGLWTMQTGESIKVSHMTDSHIRNTIRVCEKAKERATFSCEREKWDDWIDVFHDEINRRGVSTFKPEAHYDSPSAVKPTRGKKLELVCHCGTVYSPRLADLKRGYGKSCSKRCAAIKRDYGRPDPRCKQTGVTLSKLLSDIG